MAVSSKMLVVGSDVEIPRRRSLEVFSTENHLLRPDPLRNFFFVGKMGEDKWSGQSLGGDSCDLLVSAAVIVAGLCVVGALSPRGRCGHGARRAPAGGSSFIRTRLDLLKEMRVGLQKVTC